MNDKQYKPYPDSGSIRASTTKKGPKSPDYWGNIAINLKDLTNIQVEDGLTIVKLSGWKKQDSQGRTFVSLSVDRFVPDQKTAPRPKAQPTDDFDDAPF